MKKNLFLLQAIAAAMLAVSSCSDGKERVQGPTRVCVDKNNQRIPEQYCQTPSSATDSWGYAGDPGYAQPHWYYYHFGNNGGYLPPHGSTVVGGYSNPRPNQQYFTPNSARPGSSSGSVTRGGFGSSFSGGGFGS